MKIVFYLLLSFSFVFSQELALENLLDEYEDSESLYKKTKQESAGFLLVYSRKDLEQMQAFSLKDVLKTVRMYTMQVNNVGVLKLTKSATGKKAITPIKLYIDDFEVTTTLQANALDTYADMDLYFVDHIEIYQGGSSIAFGNEPGSMIIRLYSKDPSRENSRSAQLSFDSKSGSNLSAIDAGSMGEYEYLIYANTTKKNFDKYMHSIYELSRDSKAYQAHFKLSKKDNFEVVIDGIRTSTDMFSGFGQAPLGDGSIRDYGYISATKFFDNNFKISASASTEHKQFHSIDAKGFRVPNGDIYKNFFADIKANTYKIIAEKKIVNDKHDFLMGVEFQQNRVKPKKYQNLGRDKIIKTGPAKLDIYMVYLEELYNINENHLLAFSGKLDHYKDDFSKSTTDYSIRLGYIALLGKHFKSKLFAIRRYVYPTMLQTSFTPPLHIPNPALKVAHVKMLTGELEYDEDSYKVLVGYAHKVVDDAIIFNPMKKNYINKKDRIIFNRFYVRGEYKFNTNNKITMEYFQGYKKVYASPLSGGLIQSFNKIGDVSIYNELVYRSGYSVNYGAGLVKIAKGYDYTLSASYPINKKLKVKMKGENLLDKASKSLIDPQGLVRVPAVERRAILTMEYTF